MTPDAHKQRQQAKLDRLHAVARKLIEQGHGIDMLNPNYLGGGTVFISRNPDGAPIEGATCGGETEQYTHWQARVDGINVHWCEDRESRPVRDEVPA